MLQDLRYAIRSLQKNIGFSAVIILTLALGLGANTAIFSVVNAVLLRPLPYDDPDRLYLIFEFNRQRDVGRIRATALDFLDWRREIRSFDRIAAHTGTGFTLSGDGDAELVIGQIVSAELFSVLGVQPMLGRALLSNENQKGHDQVLVLGYGLWQRRYGGDRGVIGRRVIANGKPHTIVGVMPAGFQYPSNRYQLWAPLPLHGSTEEWINRNAHYLQVVGRLKPGVTAAQAQAELDSLAGRLERQYPNTNNNVGAKVVSLNEEVVGDVRPALLTLLGAVGFVLLIACANVTNLLLARAGAREKEMAVRAAIGAGRSRLVRQVLTESVVLYLLGCVAGLLLAAWGLDLLLAFSPENIPRLEETSLDGRVLGVTFGASVLVGLVFSLVPALHISRSSVSDALNTVARSSTSGRHRQRTRAALVVAEVALSLVLLVGAGLAIRSFARLQNVDKGFDAAHVVTFDLVMPEVRMPQAADMRAFYRRALAGLATLPGLDAVGATTHLPLSGQNLENGFTVEGYEPPASGEGPVAGLRGVSPDYFRALGIAVRRGRAFTEQDREDGGPVAVVNQTFARRFWPNQDAIGKRLKMGGPTSTDPWRVVVGIAGDVKHGTLDAEPRPEVALPFVQLDEEFLTMWGRGVSVVIRSPREPADVASMIRAEVKSIDPNIPAHSIQPMEALVAESVAQPRFRTLLLGIFAGVAMVLAAVGIFGVMSYFVTQRTREIGIRIALGAQKSDVLALVVGRGAALALAGIVIGLAGAYALTRSLASLLFQIRATDPLTYAAVAVLLAAVALLASYLPARRAARVDPITALRVE